MSDEKTPEVYVVIGYQGEWSSLCVWVSGVYSDKSVAVERVEAQKRADRSNYVTWKAWNVEFYERGKAKGLPWDYKVCSWGDMTRSDAGVSLGIGPEPPVGGDDIEYTVATVPMNTWGQWDYA